MSISVRDLEKQDKGGIFVLNQTKGIERGRIVFSVPKQNGMGSDTVLIPATFIPIDLTDQVSRKQLLESSEFRKTVNSRKIEVISEEEYEKLMKEPEAREELDRLYNQQQIYMNTVQSLDNILDRKESIVDPALESTQPGVPQNQPKQEAKVENENVSPAVIQVVAFLEEEKDESAAISTLRGLGELNEEDYTYVLKNVGKEYAQLRTFCNRNLQRLGAAAR